MATSEQLEVELKFDVQAGAQAPDLRALPGVVGARPPRTFTLEATYFDTESLDLAGNRITLRRRTGGDDAGWHLKRPSTIPGARRELRVDFDGDPGDHSPEDRVPDEVRLPVLAITRRSELIPVATISTQRTITVLLGPNGSLLAEFAEDHVSAQSLLPGGEPQQWSEWEFELIDGDNKLLKAAQKFLRAGGGDEPSSASKLARAIGSSPRPVLTPQLSKRPSALELVLVAIAKHRDALLAYDPLVRIDAPDAVHQMRVATRKMRSVLSGFPDVLGRGHTARLNTELQLLARILGDARDSEVQLEIGASLLSNESPSPALIGALTGAESSIHARAIKAAQSAMTSERYFALLDSIDALLADPPAGPDAALSADDAVDKAISKARKQIKKSQQELASLTEESDEWVQQLHTIRKRAKKLRYTTDTGGPLRRKRHRETGRAAKAIQSALGDVNDAWINRERLTELAARDSLPGPDMFILGRLDAKVEADAAKGLAAYRKAAGNI